MAYEKTKDQPSHLFNGMTPREAYIWMSEEVVKPKFGHRFWGERLRENAMHMYAQQAWVENDVIVITDTGFCDELDVFVEWVGATNIAVVQLHRNDCTFEGDSRGYVAHEAVIEVGNHCHVMNNGSVPDLHREIQGITKALVNGTLGK